MTTTYARGQHVTWDGIDWIYTDTGEVNTIEANTIKPCNHCGKSPILDQDACIANLPNVTYACCGHGRVADCYMVYKDGKVLRGKAAREEMLRLDKHPCSGGKK